MTIKLLIIDIDGVMTNGTKSYDIDGNVLSKNYHDHDFTAIKRFQRKGVYVCFLSGDKRVNSKMAESRGIDFFFSRQKHKDVVDVCGHYGVSLDDTAYVGDDYYDLPVMQMVEYTFCPENAREGVRAVCDTIVPVAGGGGVVAKIYEMTYPKDYDASWLH